MLLIPVLLYVPFIQNFVKDIAVREASKATGWEISVDCLRLRWPLRLSVDDVCIVEAPGDTMLDARRLDVGVRLRPLFSGDIDVDYARLDSARYQMGNRDSIMWLRAAVDHAEFEATRLKISFEDINLDRALVDGCRVRLIMKPDTAATPRDTSASKPMVIRARDIELRRISYSMSMLPTIDSLGCEVPVARLRDGLVDISRRRVRVGFLGVDSVSATYLTPSARWLSENPQSAASDSVVPVTPDSLLWTVTADSLRLTARNALYAMRGTRPLPGLDMNYLQASDIAIAVDSFYNRGASVRVPLSRLEATERCGLTLRADGIFDMTPTVMSARDFVISTNASDIRLSASMGVGDLTRDTSLPLNLDATASVAMADVVRIMPSMRQLIMTLPTPNELRLAADLSGTMRSLDVRRLNAVYPGLLTLDASGRIDNPLDFNRMAGKVTLDGKLQGAGRLSHFLTAAKIEPGISIPPRMTVSGTVDYRRGAIEGNLDVTANDGRVTAAGYWIERSEGYQAEIRADRFPVDAFMPKLGVGSVTASLKADGHGYNPLKASTVIHLKARVDNIVYNRETYRDIMLDADVSGGHADGMLSSGNPNADLDVDFSAAIADTGYVWDIEGDVRHIDLRALGLIADTMEMAGSFTVVSNGTYNPHNGDLHGSLTFDALDWLMDGRSLRADATTIGVDMTTQGINARLNNGDLLAVADVNCPLKGLTAHIDSTMALLKRNLASKRLDVDSLQCALPPMTFSLSMGQKNLAHEYLAESGTEFNTFAVTFGNDSLMSLSASVTGLQSGTTRLDSITFNARQRGPYLIYNAMADNSPGTMDEFAHVALNGFVGRDRLGALLRQRNIKGETGYSLGLNVTATDSVATLKFVPYNPIIAYRRWTLNDSNYVSYNFVDRQFRADLRLHDDRSSLHLATVPSTMASGPDDPTKDDIILQLRDIKIQDWLAVNPFAPPVSGDVSADLRLHWDTRNMTGRGDVSLAGLTYGRERVGDFNLDLDVATDPASGLVNADIALMVDSVRAMTIKGVLNDSTKASPFSLDLAMIKFPLKTLNPFLPKGTARVNGTLNGSLEISGSSEKPNFDGWLAFDSAHINVDMLGTRLVLPQKRIPVNSGIVTFDNFDITACNDNPLSIDGTIDIRQVTDPSLDLTLRARNTQIVNSQRAAKGASAYGRAFVNLDASVRGNMQFLTVNADAAVLEGTNVTYILATATDNLVGAGSKDDMVRFVQFNDTTAVEKADSVVTTMAMLVNARLAVNQGSTIAVDLSTDGKNKVQVSGQGNLDFSMSPVNPDGRMTGRYTISKGFVRYTPPFMSEKLFDFEEGSYVAFNGDVMNPTLNVHAVDHVKVNVLQEGQNSRMVVFDIALNVTGTLRTMDVAFDMSTNDDITVENELQGMSPEQRANQAMNLLIYNTYTGPGTSSMSAPTTNALFSFLEGQINSWAANNIKGVDISFGIEQYDRTYEGSTSTAMNYSYSVSKTLFNDRFKIVVGGSYNTDPNADENLAESLLNDVSFEYMLNKSGSMYIRIFRHTGFENILEGEITQTGVGFVLKRKLNSLRDIFRFGRRKKAPEAEAVQAKQSDDDKDYDEN